MQDILSQGWIFVSLRTHKVKIQTLAPYKNSPWNVPHMHHTGLHDLSVCGSVDQDKKEWLVNNYCFSSLSSNNSRILHALSWARHNRTIYFRLNFIVLPYSSDHKVDIKEHCLPAVSPLVKVEMMRIDNVLSNFGDGSSDGLPPSADQTPQRVKPCKKGKSLKPPVSFLLSRSLTAQHFKYFHCTISHRLHVSTGGLVVRPAGGGMNLCDVTNLSPAAYRKFPYCGSRLSDARCASPGRKRRRSIVVDYKEPSLNA